MNWLADYIDTINSILTNISIGVVMSVIAVSIILLIALIASIVLPILREKITSSRGDHHE